METTTTGATDDLRDFMDEHLAISNLVMRETATSASLMKRGWSASLKAPSSRWTSRT